MAKKKTDSAEPKRRVATATDESNVPLFYANNANVEVSNWDVKIRLGIVKGATAEVVTIQDVAHVYMSHSHFRAYVKAMSDLLQKIDNKELIAHTGKPLVPSPD